MPDAYTFDDLLSFLEHAGDRGLMPSATAQALAVASRNVLGVLDEAERGALPVDDLDAVVRRFTNKRARDFTPETVKEYGRRTRRAVDLYRRWRDDPANFAVKTRASAAARRRERPNGRVASAAADEAPGDRGADGGSPAAGAGAPGTYETSLPVRPGHVVTVANIPLDLTAAEAERLAQFIRLLAAG